MAKPLKAKTKSVGHPPKKARLGKLATLADIRGAMAIYLRLADSGKMETERMTKMIYGLREIRCVIEAEMGFDRKDKELEQLADLQNRVEELKKQAGVHRG